MILEALFEKHDFDPYRPGQQLFVIEHPDSTDEYRLGPLVIVSNSEGYRVSLGVFDSEGRMQPSQSVSYGPDGRVIGATTAFGSQEHDFEQAERMMSELIEAYYLVSERAEYHHVEGNVPTP
jgi:hypothetical protein